MSFHKNTSNQSSDSNYTRKLVYIRNVTTDEDTSHHSSFKTTPDVSGSSRIGQNTSEVHGSNTDELATSNESNNQQSSYNNDTADVSGSRPSLQNEQNNQADSTNKITHEAFFFLSCVLTMVAASIVWHLISSATEPAMISDEVRLMLVGKTGAGKSASGNTILGEEAFRVEASPASVTQHCDIKNKVVNGRNITMIDTPGVLDTWLESNKDSTKTPPCILDPAHRPHVFLSVIKVGRFTDEEMKAVSWIQTHFGEEALNFTMILFTSGDLLEGKTIEKFISNSVELQNLVDVLKGRYHVFNNYDKNNKIQVTELFIKIEQLLYENSGFTHTKDAIQKAAKQKHNERDSMLKQKEHEKAQLKEELEASGGCFMYGINIVLLLIIGALAYNQNR